MAEKKKRHRLRRIILYCVGVLLTLLVCFHFWFVNHAEELIENLVNSQSNGKLELKIDKFKFNWFSRKFELRNVVFNSRDTTNSPNTYRLDVERIRIQVKSMWPLIFDKKFLIDSLTVIRPEITVTRLRSNRDSVSASDTSLSLPQEMGRVYESIQDALKVLQVDRFAIDDGTFALINNIRPQDHPIRISRIFFRLENLSVDSSTARGQEKILFSDNVSLRTSNQDILFPDGRHRLSFKNFRVNVLNRIAEFDSCTISATRGDSSNNSFQIFFDKLRMTNINFDTLYHAEVIKADSVYCINPRFRLDIDLQKREGPIKAPKIDELMQQMTGDMQLAFVSVQNGSFDINTVREGRPSSFTSDHNNFDLQGLNIDQKKTRPLTIERFAMAIRNYENFLRDSAYSIQFDSILINNNRISLGNFSYKELKNGRVINSLSMPQFEMHGMSWDELIFSQQLKAERVNLYSPVINYTIVPNKTKSGQDVFQTLAGVGNILQLRNLYIRNGQINLLFNNNTRLKLDDAYMSVSGEQLVNSRRISNIQHSVSELYFRTGTFSSGNLTAKLTNAKFREGGQGLTAAAIHVESRKHLTIDATGLSVRQVLIDEKRKQNEISGISWSSANIRINGEENESTNNPTSFDLRNIDGSNTTLAVNNGNKNIRVLLTKVTASRLASVKGKLQAVDGIHAAGKDLQFLQEGKRLGIASFALSDLQPSTLKQLVYNSTAAHDSIRVNIPSVSIVPDINDLLKGRISSSSVLVDKPVIDIFTTREENDGTAPRASLPVLDLGYVKISQPVIDFHQQGEKGASSLRWTGANSDNSVELRNLKTFHGEDNYMSLEELKLSVDQFRYTDVKGKSFDAGKGRFSATLNKLTMHRDEVGSWDWQGRVTDLYARDFLLDSIGRKKGRLDLRYARLNDLSISTSNLINMQEMASQNTDFRIREVTGMYDDSMTHYDWSNLAYDKKSRVLSVDSFNFHPTASKEDFIRTQEFQTDYITFRTGNVSIGPFDIERYIRDTVLDLGVAHVSNGYMSSYRDKRMTRKPGLETLLPTRMIRKIPVHLVVDTVVLSNARVDYEETNDKNNQTGTVDVVNLNGTVSHLRNYGLDDDDSLLIHASAFVANTLPTTLEVHASYLDTMGGFVMKVQIGQADLTRMNPVLRPLASAELKSGILDTLSMEVRGREHHAFGDMTMNYHDLKIRVVEAESGRKTILNGVLSFLANTLIRNENKNRHGTVYFKRLKDRSAINYLVKITMNGVVSSIGLKKNKKQVKRYKAESRKAGIPFFESDFK